MSSATSQLKVKEGDQSGALQSLAGHGYGKFMLVVIAAGFAAFGVYCFAQAKYRKV